MTIQQFRELFGVARAQWFAIAVCVLLGALAAAGLNAVMPVTYEAKSRLFVATPNWNDSTGSGQPDDRGRVTTYAYGDEFTQTRIVTYRELIDTERVTTGVIERLGLQTTPRDLAAKITARVVPDTVMLEITAQSGDPQESARIADAAAEELSTVVEELERPFKQAQSPVLPVLIEPADVPASPRQPRMLLNLLAGVTIGLLVGLSYAAARERMKAAGIPEELAVGEDTLGTLPAHDVPPFVSLDDLGHETAEDVRYACLRMTAEFDAAFEGDVARTILLTTPRADDAVGTAAVLMGAGLAEAGHRVVIVMTNFADPGAGEQDRGLADVLDGRASLNSVLRSDETGTVGVISAGSTQTPAVVAFAGERMRNLLAQLANAFDYVMVIGAPVLESAESLQLATNITAAVVVCPVPPATTAEIAESERLVSLTNSRLLGRLFAVESAGGSRAHDHRTKDAARNEASTRS